MLVSVCAFAPHHVSITCFVISLFRDFVSCFVFRLLIVRHCFCFLSRDLIRALDFLDWFCDLFFRVFRNKSDKNHPSVFRDLLFFVCCGFRDLFFRLVVSCFVLRASFDGMFFVNVFCPGPREGGGVRTFRKMQPVKCFGPSWWAKYFNFTKNAN